MHSPAFGLKVNGRDIFKVHGQGVTVEFQPEYQMREAARFAHLSWLEFLAMDGEDMSDCVAHYIAHQQKEMAIHEVSKP